jgi:hypothetical protein
MQPFFGGMGEAPPCLTVVAQRSQCLGRSITSAPAIVMVLAVDESLACRGGSDRTGVGRVTRFTQSKALAARPVRQARRRRSERRPLASTNCRRDSGIMLAYCCCN